MQRLRDERDEAEQALAHVTDFSRRQWRPWADVVIRAAADPVATIYEVRRAPQPLPGVSLELAVWSGNELTYVLTPDPADLRDLAAPAPPADDDSLFSDL